jgi:hypothetical protein
VHPSCLGKGDLWLSACDEDESKLTVPNVFTRCKKKEAALYMGLGHETLSTSASSCTTPPPVPPSSPSGPIHYMRSTYEMKKNKDISITRGHSPPR